MSHVPMDELLRSQAAAVRIEVERERNSETE